MQIIIIAIMLVLAVMLGHSLVERGARRAAAIWFTFVVAALALYFIARPPHQRGLTPHFRPRINRWK